jgi:uroporphyrinogen III methyltransferase/synthase
MSFADLLSSDKVKQVEKLSKIAVIGPTTAEAARDVGLKVDIVARRSTVVGLVEAIAAYFDRQ